MIMKTYTVLVKAFATLVVEAENEQGALEIAAAETSSPRGFDVDELSIDEELKTNEQVEREIRNSTWHSDNFQKEPCK